MPNDWCFFLDDNNNNDNFRIDRPRPKELNKCWTKNTGRIGT